jgi:4-amino-4-deoxy-L-arabinose transferase-like glycosyltransferase
MAMNEPLKIPPLALPLLILLAGAGLRWHALAGDVRLSPDEALFSTFARAAALNGDWLLPGALDKTPLAIYANALAQALVGEGEFGARLVGALAGILLMPVMYALARRLYPHDPSLPVIALLLTALSPYAIAFSASALTDSLMLLGVAVALWLAAGGRDAWAGVWLGLAFASKQQAIYALPLVLALGWLMTDQARLGRFATGLGAVAGLLLLWDSARPETSIFALAAANNDPGRFIRANEIMPRLAAWLGHAQYLIGPGWLTALLACAGLGGLAWRIHRQPRQRASAADVALGAYVVGYGWLHWLVAFNTYDRYLLPLLPALILLAARGLTALPAPPRLMRLMWLVIVAGLLAGASQASSGRLPIHDTGRHYAGIEQVAAYLNAAPVATVIYDHWLGWELDYYLGQWHDKRRVYYPTPGALVADALALCEIGPRYLPVPASVMPDPWLRALRQAGFRVSLAYAVTNFRVYRLIPPWSRVGGAAAATPLPGQAYHCAGS